ncbi:serpin I2 isoform X2 [Anabrus simplex]|uniref:serpin I2 isoform X2 n=1 Tax=Anabrus simplex TaxID=316456 RepID=UPI0035A3058A
MEQSVVRLLLATLKVCQLDGEVCVPSPRSIHQAVHINNGFGAALYQALSSQSGNLAVSPLGIEAVLTMAWMGAGGDTAQELLEGLLYYDVNPEVFLALGALVSCLESKRPVTFDIDNKIYVQRGIGVPDRYRQAAMEIFRSVPDEVDFINNPDCVTSCINQWAEKRSHSHVVDTLDSIDDKTRLFLLTTAYFKGSWQVPFPENLTSMEPFELLSGRIANVSMMYTRGRFKYARIRDWNAQVIQLPFKDNSFSLLLLLPECRTDLHNLEITVTSLYLKDILHKLQETVVDVYLPRFHVESSLNLKYTLMEAAAT